MVQETFLALWNRAELFDPAVGSLAAWLHTIARNRTVDRLRAAGRRPNLIPLSSATRRGRAGRAPRSTGWSRPERSSAAAASGRGRRVSWRRPSCGMSCASALAELPDAERTAIVLAYREELTQTEIAERLGWPLGTVKTRTRRALLRLRGALAEELGPGAAPTPIPVPIRRTNGTMMGEMDHSEVRELLEDAAIEPGGLERLMAGDTPTASIVAGHLAGCADCAEELERLRRSVGLIRRRSGPCRRPSSASGRSRTSRRVGRPRGAGRDRACRGHAGARDARVAARSPVGPDPHAPDTGAAAVAGRPAADRLGWLAGLAAALIVAVSGTALLVERGHDATTRPRPPRSRPSATSPAGRSGSTASRTSSASQLASATGTPDQAARSSSRRRSTELVVVADGLTPPPAGQEYRCWVEVGGARTPIGKMFFGGELAYWVGECRAGASAGAARRSQVRRLASSARPRRRRSPGLVAGPRQRG